MASAAGLLMLEQDVDDLGLARLNAILREWRTQRIDCADSIRFGEIPYFVLDGFPAALPHPIPEHAGSLKPGEYWGEPEKTYGFCFSVIVPDAWKGGEVRFKALPGITGRFNQAGCEGLLFCNKEIVQGLDGCHPEAVLLEEAAGGEELNIILCVWTGTTGAAERYQPCWGGKYRFREAEIYALRHEARDFLGNFECLIQLTASLHQMDPEKERLRQILHDALREIGLAKPGSEDFLRRVAAVNRNLLDVPKASLKAVPEVRVAAVGHAHIDIGWLWPVSHSRGKIVRTASTVLHLINRFPSFVFLQSQPQLIEFLEQDAPQLFRKFREAVQSNRIELNGITWVEPDCNLPSGESLVRQFLYGFRCINRLTDRRPAVLWLPDTFGFPASLPQIAKSAGVRYFVTSKLSWNETNRPEEDTFIWRGLDGSELLAYFLTTPQEERNTYNGILDPEHVVGAWQRYHQKEINNHILVAFGYGDGGGGPNEKMVENVDRINRFSEKYRIDCQSVQEFMERLEKQLAGNPMLPVIDGELYLEKHRGTYTSQASAKRMNRRCENVLAIAEQLSVWASMDAKLPYPKELFSLLWKKLLVNQFHDILPGTSCRQVYSEAEVEHAAIVEKASESIERALASLTMKAPKSVVLYNPHSFPVSAPVFLDAGSENCMVDDAGRDYPLQAQVKRDGSRRVGFVEGIPPMGFKSCRLEHRNAKLAANASQEVFETYEPRGKPMILENRYLRVCFHDDGTINSILHKPSGRETLSGRGNQLILFEDKPYAQDAWTLDPGYERVSESWNHLESSEIIEHGAVRTVLRQKRRLDETVWEQDIVLYAEAPLIFFHSRVDWRQRHTLLKASFPLNLVAKHASCEIQFGHVLRPTTRNNAFEKARFEVVAHRFADLSEGNWGVALINDSKYGHDILGSRMRISLLRGPCYPDPEADYGFHEFAYALYPHEGDLNHSDVVMQAAAFNRPILSRMGAAAGDVSYLNVEPCNVIVEALKLAEDGAGFVLRMYQSLPQRERAHIRMSREIRELSEINILEEFMDSEDTNLDQTGKGFHSTFCPFQIKSFFIRLES